MTSDETLAFLLPRLRSFGDRPAVIAFEPGGQRVVGYAELEDQAMRLAGGLLARGVTPGEPIALFAENSPEWVAVRLALLAVGARTVPLDYLITEAQLAEAVADCGARRLFTTREHLAAVSAAGVREVYLLDCETAEEGAEPLMSLLGDRPDSLPHPAPEDVVALFYTSGTTGAPKGVPLSQRNLAINVATLMALATEMADGSIGPDDRVLLPLPLHHSYPFIVGMLVPLASGATIVLPEGVGGPQIVGALRDGRVSVLIGVPRLYEALLSGIMARAAALGGLRAAAFRGLMALSIGLRRRFGKRVGLQLFGRVHRELAPRLRLLVCGGARLDADVEWRLEGLGWLVTSGYGLVETTSISTFNPPERTRPGSVGRPAPGVELRIDRPDAQGQGEVLLRGPTVFAGYRNNPQANREAFTGDGWFRTGDRGYLDDDGYLFITGRFKEMIVLPDGKNIAPDEVEAAYAASPYVGEVAVLEQAGALVGLVVPDMEALRAAGTGRIEDALRVSLAECSRGLPPYKRISGYAVGREPLPRTRLGKYRRHLLTELYARAQTGAAVPAAPPSEADATLLAKPRAAQVWHWLERRYPDRPLSLETSPQLDLGIDSLAWLEIGLAFERAFGFRLSEEAAARVLILRDLLQEVEAAPAAAEAAPGAAGLSPDDARWLVPAGALLSALGFVARTLVWAVMRACFRLRVDGAEHLPRTGPAVLVCNHLSDLDPFVVVAGLPWSRMRLAHWGADRTRLFGTPLRRGVARMFNLFPVDDRTPGQSLAFGREVLARGGILIWFPEEWRSPTGELQTFLPGVGVLIAESGAPAVPMRIGGTFEAMSRYRRVPRLIPVRLTIGAAIGADTLAARGGGDDPSRRIADALQDAVGSLGETGRE